MMPGRSAPPTLSAGTVSKLTLAAILASGLGQNAARYGARVFGGQRLDHGVHSWWLTPLGDALLVAPLMAVLLLLATRWLWFRRSDVVWVIALTPLLMSALAVGTRLHLFAITLLGIGLASRVGPFAARVIGDRGISRLAAGLGAATLLVAVPFAAWPAIQERRSESGLPPARDGAPNVLVLLWDTVRAASLDLYGNPKPTSPSLTEFARGGVVFDWAISTASYTLPSHASLFTGKWAHELPTNWSVPLDDTTPTLAEVLARAGYRTGGFSANRIYVTREWGLGRGFAHFDEHRIGLQEAIRSSTLVRRLFISEFVRRLTGFNSALATVTATRNHDALLPWLERGQHTGKPYFAFVNFMDAHNPYLPPDSLATRFGWFAADASREERWNARKLARHEGPPPDAGQSLLPAYEAAIADLDSHVGRLLSELRQRRLLENTMVIVLSDHGEEFGEHDQFGHGNSLYIQSLRVPLVVTFPGRVPEGKRVNRVVSTRDVAATILDLVGLEGVLPGVSLRSAWESDTVTGAVALSEIRQDARLPERSRAREADVHSAVTSGLQVIRTGDSIEAFDLARDPSGRLAASGPSVDTALRALPSPRVRPPR